jgi:hypothetical protein
MQEPNGQMTELDFVHTVQRGDRQVLKWAAGNLLHLWKEVVFCEYVISSVFPLFAQDGQKF